MRWVWAGAVLVAAWVASTQPARAGCPNVCDLTVSAAPTIDPAIPCLTALPNAATCNCGVILVVTNHCPDVVNATDFQFTSCGAPGAAPTDYQCPSLQPGQQGEEVLAIPSSSGIGAKSWTLHVQEGGAVSAITVDANVTSFGAGCACGIAPAPAAAYGSTLSLAAAGALAAVILGARRRRRPRRLRERHA
jgi:hypothetical protein